MNMAIKVSGRITAASLKETWKRMRFYEPGLATTIEDGFMHYRVPSEQDLDAWVEETFIISAGDFDEVYPTMKPIKYATVYWLPDSSELVFRCSHWRTDGQGVWMFWNKFLSSVGQSDLLVWGNEIANLAVTTDVHWNRLPTSDQTTARNFLQSWASNIPGVGPPSKVGQAPPGTNRYSTFTFSEQDTRNILRNRKVTVTSALHAAFALANAKHHDQSYSTNVYATFGSFSSRHAFEQSIKGASKAVNLYYMSLPMMTPVTEFDEMSRHLAKQYKDYQNQLAGQGRGEMFAIVDAMYEHCQSPDFFEGPVSRDALFSNIGIVEDHLKIDHGDIQIVDMKGAMDIVAGLSIVSVCTWKGQLAMTYSYNDGYQTAEETQMLLNTTARILISNCSPPKEDLVRQGTSQDYKRPSGMLRSKL